MPTVNKDVGSAWGKVADEGDEFFLSLPFKNSTEVFIASVAAGGSVAPGVIGHPLRSGEVQEMNRTLIGPGEIHARCPDGNVSVSLTTWT